jgi:peptidoglycan/LPS O-acetylase OafA/YrhL
MNRRLIYLDVVRGMAILLVLGAHVAPVDWPAASPHTWIHDVLLLWQRIGVNGVPLFFVLSGFLIGGLLFHEYRQSGRIGVKRFYVRRAFKIWPPYILWLVCMYPFVNLLVLPRLRDRGVELPYPPDELFWRLLWPNFLHIQNYVLGNPDTTWVTYAAHTWSLAVEEHFYLLLPIVLFVVVKHSRRSGDRELVWVPRILVAAVLGSIVMRYGTEIFGAVVPHPTHLHLDGLGAGVLLAYVVHFRPGAIEPLRRWRWWLFALGVCTLVPTAYLRTPAAYYTGLVLLDAGALALVLWAWFLSRGELSSRADLVRGAVPAPLLVRCVAAIGVFSYSIYIWHVPFAQAVGWQAGQLINREPSVGTYLLAVGLYLVFAIGWGILMYRLVEAPALYLRRRLVAPRAAHGPLAVGPALPAIPIPPQHANS